MHRRQATGTAARAGALVWLLAAGGCSHLPHLPHFSPHWPWHHRPAAPPAPVHELDVSGADAPASFAQYWKRNTLVVDLSAAPATGRIVLKPAAGTAWPMRLAFRVMPGRFGVLEVRGAERVLLPISAAGHTALDLELAPDVYRPDTAEITVSWGPELAPSPDQPPGL
jgi:hypothetical protein